jgi:hypothetical protein
VEFERAYELAPNFRALYNIALVNIQLGRYAEATRSFKQYLHDGGDAVPPTRRAEVVHTLSDLELRTATIDVSANVNSVHLQLDGKPITAPIPGSLLIDAGEHTLTASAPGYDRLDKSLTLAGNDHVSVRFNLVAVARNPPIETGGPEVSRTRVFWPGVIATGALAAGAGISLGFSLDANSSLNGLKNTYGSTQDDRNAAANRANTANLVADVLGGLAVVTGGATLYLSLRGERAPKAPSIAITPRSVVLTAEF